MAEIGHTYRMAPRPILTPAVDFGITQLNTERKLYRGLDLMAHQSVGYYRRRRTYQGWLLRTADRIAKRSDKYRGLSDRHLRDKMDELRPHFAHKKPPPLDAVCEALAVLRETAERKLGLHPYPVQIAGALAMYNGYLAEMATGEGKTLTAGLTCVMLAWRNVPVHVITSNDYLAERDAEWIGPLYHFCGLKAGSVTGAHEPPQRRAGYACEVTYVTSKEVVADFLRDRITLGRLQDYNSRKIWSLDNPAWYNRSRMVMRGLHSAVIDEADHLLIDEAVTPVIICQPHENNVLKTACREAADLAAFMEEDKHFTVNRRYREIELQEEGRKSIIQLSQGYPGLWKAERRGRELIVQALEARYFYTREKNYVIEDGKIVLVDEFTGRIMPSRSWRAGMHQAVEAKEGLDLSDPTETTSSLSLQRFFRFYRRLSGMTGTAFEARDEFWEIYHLPMVQIPTNRPVVRNHNPTRFFVTEDEKWDAVADQVQAIHAVGQPLLIGVRTVSQSERLSAELKSMGLEHSLLNAVRHKEEAQIVAQAGKPGRITIATNMAGRGTDILLGDGVVEQGGLFVLLTEKYESKRIDRQFIGRCARQGDPGECMVFASLEDELIVKNLSASMHDSLKEKMQSEKRRWVWERLFAFAQWNSERKSGQQRKSVLRMDDWLEEALPYSGAI